MALCTLVHEEFLLAILCYRGRRDSVNNDAFLTYPVPLEKKAW